jgi:serine/threonine-protein kinase
VETSLKDIWVIDVERGSRSRLTLESTKGMNTVPLWTRDGTRVTFSAVDGRVGTVHSMPADGGRPPEPILVRESWAVPGSWSPDGRTLAFHDLPPGGNRDILVFTPVSGEPPEPFLVTPFNERSPAFSPDGRWLAYVSDESGRDEVYVRAYPGPGPKTSVSTDGGIQPLWSPDGTELFYRQGENMMIVAVETKARSLRTSKPRVLFRGRYLIGNPNHPNYSVSPDGRRFVMVQDSQASAPRIGVVLHWQDALQDENQ